MSKQKHGKRYSEEQIIRILCSDPKKLDTKSAGLILTSVQAV